MNHVTEERRIEVIFEQLVKMPSDTGTKKERDIEELLLKIISEMAYFKEIGIYAQDKGFYPIEGDALERGIVWAMVKGESSKTVVLMHHHDVVDVSDYRELAPFAYDMEIIKEKLKTKEGLPKEVEEDLLSDEWLFGRGTADMKAGAAIQLAVLEDYSQQKIRPYNLLLLSVPDEENMSVGMRQGVKLLKSLKDKYHLSYELLINSEPHEREEKTCGTLYTGSVGKLMPVIYTRGVSTHIGKIYSGFNPILVAEKIASKLELNTDFCDVVNGEVTPPPSMVYLRDRKMEYNVSTPQSIGMYFSLLLLTSGVEEVLFKLKRLSEEALEEAVHQVERSYENYYDLLHKDKVEQGYEEAIEHASPIFIRGSKDSIKSNVKSFGEIYALANKMQGEVFICEYQTYLKDIKIQIEEGELSLPESTFLLIEKVLSYIPSKDPIVIIAFAPPFYPSVQYDNSELVNRLSHFAKENWHETYIEKKYFMGISDMSYVGQVSNHKTAESLKENMPQWQGIYEISFEAINEIAMPMINIGPWGKDLHQYSERVYKKDVFEQIPRLLSHLLK